MYGCPGNSQQLFFFFSEPKAISSISILDSILNQGFPKSTVDNTLLKLIQVYNTAKLRLAANLQLMLFQNELTKCLECVRLFLGLWQAHSPYAVLIHTTVLGQTWISVFTVVH